INVTKSLLTRDKWQQYTKEANLRAAWLGSAYYAFGSVSLGVFEPTAFAGLHNDVTLISAVGGSGYDTGFDAGFGGSATTTTPMPDWVTQFDTTGAHNGILIDPTDQRIAF